MTTTTHDSALRRPSETPATGDRARPAAVALWVLVWLALLNATAAVWLDRVQGNRGYVVLRSKWRLVLDLHEPVDYLILGDSSCNQGIDPRQLGEELGGTALNLCTVGDMTTIGDAWLLQGYLERHEPPTAIVVGHAYDVWARDESKLKLALWNLEAEGVPWRTLRPPVELDVREAVSNAVAPYTPLYTQPEALRRSLTGSARPRIAIDDLGFLSVPDADPGRVEQDVDDHLEALATSAAELSATNARGLSVLLATARGRGIPVVLVNAPVVEQLGQAALYQERIAAINALLDSELAATPTARLALREPLRFPPEHMQNADHVTAVGAERYTRAIAEAVQSALAPPDPAP